MVRHHHVVSYPVNDNEETQVWWLTLPGVLSFIRKVEYHTGDTVYFNTMGEVDHVLTSDNFCGAL